MIRFNFSFIKVYFTLAILTICFTVSAQNIPQGINYQAVVRDANGNAKTFEDVALQFSIYQTTPTGTLIWKEKIVIQTNNMGQCSHVIGTGDPVTPFNSNSFSLINWGADSTFLKVELNANSSFTGTFSSMGPTTKFQSVPYALAAPDPTPAGIISAFAGVSAPNGYLMCRGQAISRTLYSDLFSTIGTAYGIGDGSSTFNVPDLRGMFLRGMDSTAINDTDAATRTAVNGGNSGAKVGSYQADNLKSHNHTITGGDDITANPHNSNFKGAISNIFNGTTQSTGGSETRPKNIYVNYIIKY